MQEGKQAVFLLLNCLQVYPQLRELVLQFLSVRHFLRRFLALHRPAAPTTAAVTSVSVDKSWLFKTTSEIDYALGVDSFAFPDLLVPLGTLRLELTNALPAELLSPTKVHLDILLVALERRGVLGEGLRWWRGLLARGVVGVVDFVKNSLQLQHLFLQTLRVRFQPRLRRLP